VDILYRRSVAMCADAKPGQATTEAKRPTHLSARARGRVEGRAFLVLSEAEGDPADKTRAAVVPCLLGGRGSTPADNTRAVARHQSRCLTRARFSLSVHLRRATRGGTVNRPSAHVTHRKQTSGHHQGRNFPVHFLLPFSPRILRADRTFLPGVPETLRVLGWLPETVNRVETHVSHRKQTSGHTSTRNVPAHGYFRVLFARVRTQGECEEKTPARRQRHKRKADPFPVRSPGDANSAKFRGGLILGRGARSQADPSSAGMRPLSG